MTWLFGEVINAKQMHFSSQSRHCLVTVLEFINRWLRYRGLVFDLHLAPVCREVLHRNIHTDFPVATTYRCGVVLNSERGTNRGHTLAVLYVDCVVYKQPLWRRHYCLPVFVRRCSKVQ